MVSSKLKKRFEASVARIVKPLASVGLRPNHLTVLGFLASFAAAYAYANYGGNRLCLVSAGSLILLSGFIDAVDGTLARTTEQVSVFGGFLDSVTDRYSDSVVLSGVTLGGLCHPVWGFIALIGSLMVSYTRSRAEAEGVSMAGVGLFERAERMILLALSSFIAYYWLDAINWGIVLLAALANLTVAQRALHFRKSV